MVLFPRFVVPLCRLASRSSAWRTGVYAVPRLTSPVRGVPVVSGCVRRFCTEVKAKSEVVQKEEPQQSKQSSTQARIPGYIPTDFEKWMLVFTGRYPSKADIPPEVSYDELTLAKDKMRVYVSTSLVVLTFVAAFGVAMWGRSERDRGESLLKRNLQRKAEQRQKHLEEMAASQDK